MGFFLPGDSLLVSAGIFARAGVLPLGWLLVLGCIAAVTGDQLGYIIGWRTGQALYSWPDSLFFKKKHLERTQKFYAKHGAKTIVFARFVPIVRTFAPLVAGVAQMEYKTFVSYNVFGGIFWVLSTVLGGYCLASLVPDIEKKIHMVIVVVVILSIIPAAVEILRERRKSASA
ncbi:MAG: VTT domain-containing protein [Elusimicrobia bacterium]|nr:VTT domain-containing protein [Elusimicrobiota bacterium]